MSAETSVASSPEALDDLVHTTTTRGWIALTAAAAVVAIGIVWAFVATIPLQTSATAVVYEPGSTHRVVAGGSGSVALSTSLGAAVSPGETIGTVTPYAMSGSAGAAPLPIVSSVAGVVSGIYVEQGTGVDPSTVVLAIATTSGNADSVRLVTYLGAADAAYYHPGQSVDVTLSNLSTSDTLVAPATVRAVGNVPVDLDSMRHTLKDDGLATQQLRDAGGVAYLVELELDGLGSLTALERPADGQVVEITNTYSQPHPVELLFGSTS